ncbi:uncharacterized protein LOC143986729 [Lithobates pipiens]
MCMWRKERWKKERRWAPHQVMLWLWKATHFQAPVPPPEDVEEGEVEEGEVEEVGELGTPPGDVLFVERAPFSSDSAQRLIGQIMGWNGELDDMRTSLDLMKTQIDNMQLEMKNMIDILGRI